MNKKWPGEAVPSAEPPLELAGQTAGLLTVLRYAGSKSGKGALWECRCRCGAIVHCGGNALRKAQRDGSALGCAACRQAVKAEAFKRAVVALCAENGYPIDWVETPRAILIRLHKQNRPSEPARPTS